MYNKLSLVSYTLATMAGLCFVGGLVILSGEGRLENGEVGHLVIHG